VFLIFVLGRVIKKFLRLEIQICGKKDLSVELKNALLSDRSKNRFGIDSSGNVGRSAWSSLLTVA
jgi:hypothetical protein